MLFPLTFFLDIILLLNIFLIIFSNQIQVPPAELEHILHTNPEIADAAVVPYVSSPLMLCSEANKLSSMTMNYIC